ncbi:hypothetical protein [Amphritea atlantica]|uniref:hypothetical protein n=1 Tax=Amphritea atlantica TaxID=355243 RepID=UPI001587526D|nr:hypothetical protein [Amphritea atlantica]
MHLPPILKRLKIDQKEWLSNVTQFEILYPKKFATSGEQFKPPEHFKRSAQGVSVISL